VTRILALGIDVGSATVKMVGVDGAGILAWEILEPAQARAEDQIERIVGLGRDACEMTSKADGGPFESRGTLIATGCGRGLVHQAARQVTEITCHARGVFREVGHGGTLVDVGGQDSKVIAIGARGEVTDFAMNDKCAAGTGRFIENVARRLEVPLEAMGEVALGTSEEARLSSTCTVFAESEVVSLLAHGVAVEPIVRGLHRALILRLVAMIRTVGPTSPLMLSGGVVRNPAIARLLEEEIGQPVVVPKYPQLMGAYGAALIGLETG
jgi:predicted CoA-substrate-specific enzyme activase